MGRYLIALFLVVASANVYALETTIKLGMTSWKPMQKGLYVQEDYDHKIDYKSPFMAVGVKSDLSNHFGLAAEVFNLGSYATHSDVTSHEQLWIHGGAAAAGPADAHSSTYGSAYGVSLVGTTTLGPVTFGAGPAVFFYRWNLQIYSKLTNTLNVDHTEHMRDIGYTLQAQVNVSKNWQLGASFYDANDSSKDIYPRGTGQVLTGYIGYSY